MCVLPGLHAPPEAGQAVRACALGPAPLPAAIPRSARQPGGAGHAVLLLVVSYRQDGHFLQQHSRVFCAASTVFLMEVTVSLHITLSAFLPWFQLQKFVFLFRGIFPLVLHNCHTLKHLYAQVCSVNYILKLLNAQPFSSTNLVMYSCLASVLWTGLTVFMLFYPC